MAYWQNPIQSPVLRPGGVLDRFCFSTGDPEPAPPTVVRVVPDGRCELIFSTPVSRNGVARGPAQCELFGVRDRPLLVPSGRPAINTSVRLFAGPARELFGLDLAEATDTPVALEDLWGDEAKELGERLATASNHCGQQAIIEAALEHRLQSNTRRSNVADHAAHRAADLIRQSMGQCRIAQLCTRLGIGERRLERAFGRLIGLSPKTYARIMRFDRAMEALREGRDQSSIALTCGYFDQAHMLRDFRTFAGVPPSQYRDGPVPA
jgi:AraC-like DNA-binding protein